MMDMNLYALWHTIREVSERTQICVRGFVTKNLISASPVKCSDGYKE